jgi:septal ring factor EnvC (AmiA/AmiB activator)
MLFCRRKLLVSFLPGHKMAAVLPGAHRAHLSGARCAFRAPATNSANRIGAIEMANDDAKKAQAQASTLTDTVEKLNKEIATMRDKSQEILKQLKANAKRSSELKKLLK